MHLQFIFGQTKSQPQWGHNPSQESIYIGCREWVLSSLSCERLEHLDRKNVACVYEFRHKSASILSLLSNFPLTWNIEKVKLQFYRKDNMNVLGDRDRIKQIPTRFAFFELHAIFYCGMSMSRLLPMVRREQCDKWYNSKTTYKIVSFICILAPF